MHRGLKLHILGTCTVNSLATVVMVTNTNPDNCHFHPILLCLHGIKKLKCALKHDVWLRDTLLRHNNQFLSPYLLLGVACTTDWLAMHVVIISEFHRLIGQNVSRYSYLWNCTHIC